MKIYRFLTTTMIITLVALMYVNQNVASIRLSYDIKEKERLHSELLDRNKILLYNVKYLESPARLEKVLLAQNLKLEVPPKERVILVSATSRKIGAGESKGIMGATGPFGRIRQAIASIFVLGPEAQARPIK
ncbi:MAG: hypothetical protein ABH847_04835 [Candidatus Omnitrophota bacterium]